MKNDARLHIYASHRSIFDGSEDVKKFDVPGTYSEVNGAYYVFYEEKDDETGTVFSHRLKIEPTTLTRHVKGTYSNDMLFELGKETGTVYNTPYGTFSMRFLTKNYSVTKSESEISVLLEYILSLNGEPSSEVEMKIKILKKD